MRYKDTPFGNIPEQWDVKTINEITYVVTDYVANGSFASLKENVHYKNEKDAAVLIRLADFNNNFDGNFVYIDEHAYEFLNKSKLFGGEIIISNVGANVGTVFHCPKLPIKMSLAPNSIMVKFRGCEDFYYYWLNSPYGQHMLRSIVTGSAQPKFNKTNFRNMLVPVPSIQVQEKIAAILKTLDAKIEANEAINKNLLQHAQALYKDRFIDLTPFDGSMPSDWHLGTVSEIIELHDSKRIPLSSRERAGLDKIYPYYGATSVMDYVDRYLFDGVYLLLGEDGTVIDGKGFPILQYVEGKFWVNNHAHIITGKNGFTVEMLYLLFSLTSVQSIVTGAVQPKISQANLKKVPVVIPSETELQAFDKSIQPFFAEIRNLRSENDRLATIRDSLLPHLMSGEIDVSGLDL